jgi:uncharacterized membrane protein YjfL (UPF0719 family)
MFRRDDHRAVRIASWRKGPTMDRIAATAISLAFLGLFVLIVGYTIRDTKAGPCVMWAGVTCMLSIIAYYILRRLS